MPQPTAPSRAATGVAREMAGTAPCGGCGAKLGSGALPAVIAGYAGAERADTERLPGDDAAVIRFGAARQVISTDHLRAFALDPALVARVAAVHALGDVWAMGAAPQSAVATVILPRMEARLQGAWLGEVMGAAHDVFRRGRGERAGGSFVDGGGADGGVHRDGSPRSRAGDTWRAGKPGDALILTKPLGSGVILAGEMQGKAAGVDVLACWEAMSRPQGRASAVLAPVAQAMTDVTGFGLAGHLVEHLRGFGHRRELSLDAVPLLRGGGGAVGAWPSLDACSRRTGRRWSPVIFRLPTTRARHLLCAIRRRRGAACRRRCGPMADEASCRTWRRPALPAARHRTVDGARPPDRCRPERACAIACTGQQQAPLLRSP
jgi:selenide,water dikinase